MKRYSNKSGRSGIISFEAARNFIDIEFQDGSIYRYDYTNPGKSKVEEMKRLAPTGKGLTTYINQEVRDNYAKKLK